MINAVIVDDEEFSRKNLQLLLSKHCAETIKVLAECDNIDDAFSLINKLKPGVVFLDIEMGSHTGFDLIAKFPQPEFRFIFVTAYDKYALKAIKFCALDYILKPVNHNELIQAIAKFKTLTNITEKENIKNLINNLKTPNHKSNKITIPTTTGFTLVPVENIQYMKAENSCTMIYVNNNNKLCSTISLGDYEDLLSEYTFFRTHHSYMVNKEFITDYVKGEGGQVVLQAGDIVPISKRRKLEFLDWLNA